jgi:hypothetical protein
VYQLAFRKVSTAIDQSERSKVDMAATTFDPVSALIEGLDDVLALEYMFSSNLKAIAADRRRRILEFEKSHPKISRMLKNRALALELLQDNNDFASEEDAYQFVINDRRKRPSLQFCKDSAEEYMRQFTPQEFLGFLRFSRDDFETLTKEFAEALAARNMFQSPKATPAKFLLAGLLRWLGGGSPHDIIFFCGLRMSTFLRVRWDLLDVLIDLYYDRVVFLPETEAERLALRKKFAAKSGIDGILGAKDGLLVHIKLPANTQNARTYLCYKSFYALNMQGVADDEGAFQYVNIGWTGATGDSCAAQRSTFWKRCERDEFKFSEGTMFISFFGRRFVSFRCFALRCVALRCVALRCVALHSVALSCVASHCVRLPFFALCYYHLRCATYLRSTLLTIMS